MAISKKDNPALILIDIQKGLTILRIGAKKETIQRLKTMLVYY